MRKIYWLFKIFYLPAIFYFAFFVLKLTGHDPDVDLTGMHTTMGAFFLSGGAAIAYLMSILPVWKSYHTDERMHGCFWLLSALFLSLLLSDASFRIHESIDEHWGIPDVFTFMFYGLLLIVLVGVYRKTFQKPFWLFLAGFVILSGMAVLGDMSSSHEGLIHISGGRSFSYEQFCETLSTLLLACAFASEAIADLKGFDEAANNK